MTKEKEIISEEKLPKDEIKPDSDEFYKYLHTYAKDDLKETNEAVEYEHEVIANEKLINIGEKGFLSKNLSQDEILKVAPLITKTKVKNWDFPHSRYCFDFSLNSQRILIGNMNGMLKSMEWKGVEKTYVDLDIQPVKSVKYLHKLNMVATAENELNVYGEQGHLVHNLRKVHQPTSIEYLPFHYVLVAGSQSGHLNFVDVGVGEIISTIGTFNGSINVMCQNKMDATICTAHNNGIVNFWTPNTQNPVLKFLTTNSSLNAIDIDYTGRYIATCSSDRKVRTFDIRQIHSGRPKFVTELYTGAGVPISLSFSQTGLLAVGAENHIRVLKNVYLTDSGGKKNYQNHLYLTHSLLRNKQISQVKFCPYEDILGVSTYSGVHTIIVPSSGNPDFDEFEDSVVNTSRKFRKNEEIQKTLARVPPEMIKLSISHASIDKVNFEIAEDDADDEKRKIFGGKEELKMTKKKSKKRKPKPANSKSLQIKDNLYHERLVQKRKLIESEISDNKDIEVKKQRPLTNTALDNLIYSKK